jgi:hypothetical protein
MNHSLGIIDLLKPFGFDEQLKTKLVRHQDGRYDVPTLMREGWFELYQSLQARPVFSGCDQIVCFVGDGSTRAKFIGVYQVLDESPVLSSHVPTKCPYVEWRSDSKYFYKLRYQPQYEDLVGRVVVDWGAGALQWAQHLRNKPVVEVFPKGRTLEPFSDYLDFTLSHDELKDLFGQPTAHRDWQSSLSAVAGIYLILAQHTGDQYIGSAYGSDGIWGRWQQYASNGHGNNVMLRHLVEHDDRYPESFRYSVLQVLPKSTKPAEVIRWENQYKMKFGSRAIGLNQAERRSKML